MKKIVFNELISIILYRVKYLQVKKVCIIQRVGSNF